MHLGLHYWLLQAVSENLTNKSQTYVGDVKFSLIQLQIFRKIFREWIKYVWVVSVFLCQQSLTIAALDVTLGLFLSAIDLHHRKVNYIHCAPLTALQSELTAGWSEALRVRHRKLFKQKHFTHICVQKPWFLLKKVIL